MTPTSSDADLLVVGNDSVALLLALLAAQRFMQVIVVTNPVQPVPDADEPLDDVAVGVLERAGLVHALQSISDDSGVVQRSMLRSTLQRAATDAGVVLIGDSLQSFDVGDSVAAVVDDGNHSRHLTTRWMASTASTVRELLGVDLARVGTSDIAAQFRAGPVFLVGDGAVAATMTRTSGFGDADNLAWRLQAVHQGHAHDRLLDAYDAERRSQLLSMLTEQNAQPMLQVGQLAGSHPLVGTHVPPTLIDGRPLAARLNHGWAILTSDVAMLPHDLLCQWIGVGARIVMLGESMRQVERAPHAGAVVVRPDRIVAAVATDADEFRATSEQLFGWYADGEPLAAPAG